MGIEGTTKDGGSTSAGITSSQPASMYAALVKRLPPGITEPRFASRMESAMSAVDMVTSRDSDPAIA